MTIKVLPSNISSDEEKRQRVEREAQTISSLNHPNICALYDVGNQDGVEYLVLEYVEGETLEKRLEKGPLPTKTLQRHAMEIAQARENAHRRGVVHRDLKPANIMLTKSGAKLLDFGLAKWSATGTSKALKAAAKGDRDSKLSKGKPIAQNEVLMGLTTSLLSSSKSKNLTGFCFSSFGETSSDAARSSGT